MFVKLPLSHSNVWLLLLTFSDDDDDDNDYNDIDDDFVNESDAKYECWSLELTQFWLSSLVI